MNSDNLQLKGKIEKILQQNILLKSNWDHFEIKYLGKDIERLKKIKEGQLVEIIGKLVGKEYSDTFDQIKYYTQIIGYSIKEIKDPLEEIKAIIHKDYIREITGKSDVENIPNEFLESNFEISKIQFHGIISNLSAINYLPDTEYSSNVLIQVIILKSESNFFEIQFLGKDVELLINIKEGQLVKVSGKLQGKKWQTSSQTKYYTNIIGKNIEINKI